MEVFFLSNGCPGGRPSVSTNYKTIEASDLCIEMTTVHAICKHRKILAVSQRVPLNTLLRFFFWAVPYALEAQTVINLFVKIFHSHA